MATKHNARRWAGLGSRVAEARHGRKLSQSQLARLLDVHPLTISRIERGVSHPRPEAMARIADVLRVSPAFLEYGVDESRAP